jgi:DNA-binding NarL/FixJ family response regulator
MAQNILLIQDDPSDAGAVREALIRSSDGPFQVEWVRRCFDGLGRLVLEGTETKEKTDRIAAVLVDLFLPDSQGIETFNLVFQAAPQIPILVLSSTQDEAVAKLAVRQGAQDYLLKGRLDGYMLPKAVGNMVERAAIAEALFEEKERALVTLNSIGDAVLSIDLRGRVTYLNVVAESMTGWSRAEAMDEPIEEVFRIIDA